MKDIVEDALEQHEILDSEPSPEEFGEPQIALLGYGHVGAALLQQEWVSDSLGLETSHVQRGERRPDGSIDADYAVLVGADDDDLAAAVGEWLPAETTSIAIPVGTPATPVGHVSTVDATISCPRARVQELVTDLLGVLPGRTLVSPPPGFYDRIRTVGRVYGFRGQCEPPDDDSSPAAFAENLVTDALANPFDTGGNGGTEHFFSLLCADEAVTLETFDAVRDEIADRLSTGDRTEPFAVDTRGDTGGEYRLTLLRR